ncbi:MAG: phage tail protein [Victivallales bacterium]|nr:phage tail protein [Victivallales bacterium]
MLVGIFGALPFTCSAGFVQTFSRFSRTLGEKWAKHQIIGGKPVLEWTGSEAASITLTVRLDASLGLPPSAGMLMLKAMLESHDAYSLVIGTDYFGKFVLEGIEEDRRHFTGAGICLVDEVSLKLTEHSRGWA